MSAVAGFELTVRHVDAGGWRQACLELDEQEGRFQGLFVTPVAAGGPDDAGRSAHALSRDAHGAPVLLV